MVINVSQAICGLTAEKITVARNAPGNYVDGVYVSGKTKTFRTLASVQQPTPKQLETLPENERTRDVMLFISKRALRTGADQDSTEADIISRIKNGITIKYKVIGLADWEVFGHTPAMAARLS